MKQKWVFDGPYREFRGYVFANRKPTTIEDQGTLDAIWKVSGFSVYEEPEKANEEVREAAASQILESVENPDACPKCGRIVKVGKTMHVKWCKGK